MMNDFTNNFFFDLSDMEPEELTWDELLVQAQEGDPAAQQTVAATYLCGSEDGAVAADGEKALYWFLQLAEADIPEGAFNAGLLYAKGFGAPRDLLTAAAWMEKAAQLGDEDGAALAEKYRGAVADLEAAKQGDAAAQGRLATFYTELGCSLDPAGPGEDYDEALHWGRLAAEQNDPEGIWVVALAYDHGRGMDADPAQAVAWYEKGVALDHAPCQHNLGCHYMTGTVLDTDEEKAVALFTRSAEQGYALAYQALGTAYQFGMGVEEDMATAIAWYEKYLEVSFDPELAQKVEIFKMLQDMAPSFDEDDEEIDESTLPEGYMAALEALIDADLDLDDEN